MLGARQRKIFGEVLRIRHGSIRTEDFELLDARSREKGVKMGTEWSSQDSVDTPPPSLVSCLERVGAYAA